VEGRSLKVAICTPTRDKPHPAYVASLERSIPALDAAGYSHSVALEVGCPYISGARATCLGKAIKWGADVYVFIDDDVSWQPEDLLKLLRTVGDVVGGTYRYKLDEEAYMGKVYLGENKKPLVREDGAIHAIGLPAGFLKVTKQAVKRFMEAYPELLINADGNENVDLFNHGAYKGVWFGEDYAFCRRWNEIEGEVWLVPDLNLDHNGPDKVYVGNYHKWLMGRK